MKGSDPGASGRVSNPAQHVLATRIRGDWSHLPMKSGALPRWRQDDPVSTSTVKTGAPLPSNGDWSIRDPAKHELAVRIQGNWSLSPLLLETGASPPSNGDWANIIQPRWRLEPPHPLGHLSGDCSLTFPSWSVRSRWRLESPHPPGHVSGDWNPYLLETGRTSDPDGNWSLPLTLETGAPTYWRRNGHPVQMETGAPFTY